MNDSLIKRFIMKISGKLIGLGLGFFTLGIVPRALGPTNFGNFGFLTEFFIRTITFVQFGTSSAYFTKISNRPNERKLIGFYFYLLLFICSIAVLITLIGANSNLSNIFWPNQKKIYIWYATLFAILTYCSDQVVRTNDAFGLTVKSEIILIIKNFIGAILVITFFYYKSLSIDNYFFIQFIIISFIIIFGVINLYKSSIRIFSYLSISKNRLIKYSNEFYNYSHPLFIDSLLIYFTIMSDRWLLQKFSGSIEQGYFTFAFRVCTIIFIFTSAMTPLIIREMSLAFKKNNINDLKNLYLKYTPLFFFIASFFAIFISFNSNDVVSIIGGEEYIKSSPTIAIMAFYPAHQTYGQLSGAVFLASEKTKIIRNVSLFAAPIGFIISMLLIGPIEAFNMNFGSIGLAAKVVFIQFIVVNIYLYIISSYLKFSFVKYLLHQIITFFVLYVFAFISNYIGLFLFKDQKIIFFTSALIYLIITLAILISFPRLFGIKIDHLIKHAIKLSSKNNN